MRPERTLASTRQRRATSRYRRDGYHRTRGSPPAWPGGGHVPVVFDVRPDAARDLLGSPSLANSPADLANQTDVVFISVVDAQQVTDVVVGPEGLLSGARPGAVFVVTATIAVKVILDLAERCQPHGESLLDCGVTGGSRATENGLIALIGGPTDLVTRVRPAIEDFTARVVHCGPLGARAWPPSWPARS